MSSQTKASHPCRDTCSGWKQGYEAGLERAELLEELLIKIQKQCDGNSDLENDLWHEINRALATYRGGKEAG